MGEGDQKEGLGALNDGHVIADVGTLTNQASRSTVGASRRAIGVTSAPRKAMRRDTETAAGIEPALRGKLSRAPTQTLGLPTQYLTGQSRRHTSPSHVERWARPDLNWRPSPFTKRPLYPG